MTPSLPPPPILPGSEAFVQRWCRLEDCTSRMREEGSGQVCLCVVRTYMYIHMRADGPSPAASARCNQAGEEE